MQNKLKMATAALAILGGMAAIAPAQAVPVTTWSFTADAGFTNLQPGGGLVQGDFTNTTLGLPSKIYWGQLPDEASSSSLRITGIGANAGTGNSVGNLTTNAAPINTATITHDNNVIQGPSLTGASIRDVLTLTPTAPAGSTINVPPLQFDITFDETGNNGLAANCPATSVTPCSDIFVLSTTSGAGVILNKSDPNNVYLSQFLPVGPDSYLINLFIDGLGVLSDSACAAAGAASGCIGLVTQEDVATSFNVRLQIVTVPEPVTVSLFGAGLIGAGALRLRRKAKKA